ncbi:MAG: serine protease [Candidatus Bathyarchaeia archaeon]
MGWSKAVLPLAIKTVEDAFTPVGTAFLIDFHGTVALVTAKHCVFDRRGKPERELYLLSNCMGGGGIYFPLDELKSKFNLSWKTLGEYDIAATIFVQATEAKEDVSKFNVDSLESSSNIVEGNDVYFLGFPLCLGVSPNAKITPVVRNGVVALRNEDKSFIVDANIFPGSSGSPVFLKPNPFDVDWRGLRLATKLSSPKLVGIITSYLPYTDVAISQQTGEEKIAFTENSGLGSALSADIIKELLNSKDFNDLILR